MLRHPATAPHPQRGPPKRRGSYNCGRCGLPKKGHVCPIADPTAAASDHPPPPPPPPPPPRSDLRLRRALSFDDDDVASPAEGVPELLGENLGADEPVELNGGPLPVSCLAEILRRLPPRELMGAAAVCRGWREVIKRLWISAEEVKLRVNPRSQIGFIGSVLNKCSGLLKLVLTMERLWLLNFFGQKF